jgi:hypothetical protein
MVSGHNNAVGIFRKFPVVIPMSGLAMIVHINFIMGE